ncbi:hypothetical protein FOE78_08775 [Microlunatus elymi]|uniref:PQ loop repeat-containing protein n=1 Tax=Microlunatus elymi TaxID=2596828 RepID=A0A516PXS6_9ACTN|nr:hypothetical protein [Microlunatus elymi]QDP95979.1 hypothetical protein FOE78_08775 [Microlunatus elymi]
MAESKIEVIVDVLGWTAAVYGAVVAVPQIARVLKFRSTAGISRLAWQSSLASNLSWVSYGVMTHHLNLWFPCLLVGLCAAWMLIMIERDRRPGHDPLRDRRGTSITLLRTFALPMVVATLAFTMAATIGSLAFSVLVFIAAAVAQLLQLRSLMTCRDISAVSVPYLAMGVVGQVLWFSWGMLAHDSSNQLVAGFLIVLTAANLGCYTLRRSELLQPRRIDIALPRWVPAPQPRPVRIRTRPIDPNRY